MHLHEHNCKHKIKKQLVTMEMKVCRETMQSPIQQTNLLSIPSLETHFQIPSIHYPQTHNLQLLYSSLNQKTQLTHIKTKFQGIKKGFGIQQNQNPTVKNSFFSHLEA